MMLLNQSINFTLVTAAIVEGLSDRGSDKEADATEKQAPAVESSN
jgi:small subunit ribosomal protein S2